MLSRLSNAAGVSGNENEVRGILKELCAPYGESSVDAMGNLYVHKKGTGPKVMLCAHMDEVGMMITGVQDNGTFSYSAVGLDPRVMVSKRVVVGKNKVPGVIGAKAIHLQKPEERTIMHRHDQLFIDIGAESKEDALKYAQIGDYVSFDTKFVYFGDGLMKGKALDDRVGCAVVVSLLEKDYDCDITAVFTVQEEVGFRGAIAAASRIEPDIALIFEGTTANDMPEEKPHQAVTQVGKGPAISVIDGATIVKPEMIKALVIAAKAANVPYQLRQGARGGTDAGAVHKSGIGCVVGGISVPCRYIHSPVSVASVADYENAIKLADAFLANKGYEEVL